MSELPRVSICIPTYNQASYLPYAIDSALRQNNIRPDLYIADDCSTDSTIQVLDFFKSDQRLHVLHGTRNSGISLNSQRVIMAATSEYVVRLDSDDILLADYCKVLCALLDANPQAAVAHCAVEEIDSAGLRLRTRRLARRPGFQHSEAALRQAVRGYKVAANICMFRKEALDSLPFIYNPELGFAEDWDLYTRLAISGWGNVYSPKVLAKYRIWNRDDALNIRRKLAELNGITHVLVNTIEESWKAKGWDCLPIALFRQKFASAHVKCLHGLDRDSADFHLVRAALITLSGVNEDFIDTLYAQLHSSSHWLEIASRANRIARDFAKSLFC